MGTDGFYKVIGAAAAGDATRHLVKEGDQPGQTLVGWLKVELDDVGDQITDGDYFRPLYVLADEDIDSVPSNVNDADSNGRATWSKFKAIVATGVDDADSNGRATWSKLKILVAAGVDDADER